MKSLPKYRAERERLLAHLDRQKQLIHNDVVDIKSSLKPLALAKQVISDAADSFRDNNFATQTTRLALTMLPRVIRHPLISIAAQIAAPMLVRNVPRLLHLVKGARNGQADMSVQQIIPKARVGVLGGLRKAVAGLRHRIKPATEFPSTL